jgi:hypothetical protein
VANMSDQVNLVNRLLQAIFTASATATFTPGTGGGSAIVITPPYFLRLMSATGTNTSNGTEATAALSPGYVALGSSLGSSAFGTPSAGQQTNNNAVSWSATGTWQTITGVEIWDSNATKLRWLQGALTSSITGVSNGDTVQFAVASLTCNAGSW